MKTITKCPISENKCNFKINGNCIKNINPNNCETCTKYRKHQSKHSIKMLKQYKVYRQPGCKL